MAEEVSMDPVAVDKLATQFQTFKTDLTKAKGKVSNVDVQPGKFADADKLKATLQDRRTQLATNLEKLANVMDKVAVNLHISARTSATTEAQNAAISTIKKSIETELPGFKEHTSTD